MRNLLRVALCFSLFTVVVSSYIRIVESGAGCQPWPGCYGQYLNNQSARGLNVLMSQGELSPQRGARIMHRLVTSALDLMILSLFILSRRTDYRMLLGQAIPAILLILTLILASIGMIHPLQPSPILILSNFIGGLMLLRLLFSLHLRLSTWQNIENAQNPNKIVPTSFVKTSIEVGLLMITLQILLGGWTSANYAAASCDALFQCQESPRTELQQAASSKSAIPPQISGLLQAFNPFSSLTLDQNRQDENHSVFTSYSGCYQPDLFCAANHASHTSVQTDPKQVYADIGAFNQSVFIRPGHTCLPVAGGHYRDT